MQRLQTKRLVIVGAGMGALYAALNLAPRPVLVLSPDKLGQGASSVWAQGGVAAAMDPNDSPENHARDTMRAGAGTVVADVATRVAAAAQEHIRDLTNLGAPFDRTASGQYVLSREAAHSFARVVRVNGDQAGAAIMAALIEKTRATPSIQVLEGVLATDILTDNGSVSGLVVQPSDPSLSPFQLDATAVLLAGGGSSGLYAMTTNPPRIRGQVVGMAARAGAVIADAEFVQFHPTALDVGEDPAPLATEALRGDGAHLVNATGERFMTALHRDAELAPRDIVARAVFAQWQAGQRPALDARAIFAGTGASQYPAVYAACQRNGIDPAVETIPIAPAAHYHMGGVATDDYGRTTIEGVWACGEVASTGLHGANRLASNGLLEALVYARICAQSIAREAAIQDGCDPVEPDLLEQSPVASNDHAVMQLRETMTRNVGVIRTGDGLRTALQDIARTEAQQYDDPQFLNMTATATLIAASALQRQESRGAHCRADFPDSDVKAAKRSQMTLSQAIDLRNRIENGQIQ